MTDRAASTEATRPEETDAAQRRVVPVWACILIGVGAALVGLAPWVITGMRLPLQNLWAYSTMPDEMPVVLLPFSQYAIVLLVGILVTGAGAGGIAARALRARLPRRGALAIALALFGTQIIAVAQTAVVVQAGLQQRTETVLYLGALVGVCVLSLATGVVAFLLIARAPRAGAVVGLSIAALAAGPWLSGVLVPFGSITSDATLPLLDLVRWVPAVLVGVAIAWGGLRTVGQVVAALFGVALVWIVPALITGITSAAGMRVLARYPGEMIDYGVGVFVMALTTPDVALKPVVVTIVVAFAAIVVRAVILRRRAANATRRLTT
ncbi:hypothetical protein AAIB33_02485 [Microbacterium sp. AZCO]|uniref:hypothetical protein n=1 Tax=Microbacterium sp. AZCO TaxID=3142976 RepID=UPI0031F34781